MSQMILLSCEHASFYLPKQFCSLWPQEVVCSHKGWDKGALAYAKRLSIALDAPLFSGSISRLLVDLNRSITHPALSLCPSSLIEKYWYPFRREVFSFVEQAKERKIPLFHFSCHTFTPVLDHKERMCDIGLLYDPSRAHEELCARTMKKILSQETSLRIRCNYPYRGISDGHTSYLRKHFLDEEYRGIELEVNQALVDTPYWKEVGVPALVRAMRAGTKVCMK